MASRNLGGRFSGQELVINIGSEPAKAKVVREGHLVPTVKYDLKKAAFFIENLPEVAPREKPRVVSQSVPAGTKVATGTAVDLVLVSAQLVPFNIFGKFHVDLAEKNLADLIEKSVISRTKSRRILLKYEQPEDVPEKEKEILIAEFKTSGVTVDDRAGADFAAAFFSGRAAAAFR